MPSVITTTSGRPASMDSTTAALANLGGTNTTETSDPVASTASLTLPNTGTVSPSKSTDCPPLPGVTPPTMVVPERSMRWVCRRPSAPVMPWTMTLELSVRKMATSVSSLRRGELGHAARGTVHGVDLLEVWQRGVGQDPPPDLGIVAVQPDDQRVGDLVTATVQQRECLHDSVGDLVTRGDAAEDVDEHAADVRVGQDDLQPVRHHFGGCTASDVQEVRRTHRSRTRVELLAGVRHHVQRRHDQPGTVADDPDLAVELDVIEVLLLGPRFERISRPGVLERRMLGMAEVGVVVEAHLAVERDDPAVGRLDQRVDLDQRRVLGGEYGPELPEYVDHLVADVRREPGRVGDRCGLLGVDALDRVDRDPRQRLGALDSELLDVDATLDAGHGEIRAVGAVEQEGGVVLLLDAAGLGDQHPADQVALDVHAQDRLGLLGGLVWGLGELDAPGLAAAAGLHLRLDHHPAADLFGGGAGLLDGLG